jgi:hypothetical protein
MAGLWGWPTMMILADPYSAPSYQDDNSSGASPRSGVVLHFPWDCGAPMLRTYRDGVETDDGSAWHFGGCTGLPTTAPGTMNRVQLQVAQDHLRVCVSDAGQLDRSAHCWDYALDLDFTQGWVSFGGHNHASVKYGGGPIWTTTWDNISFDGPAIPIARVSQVANGPGRDIGYPLPPRDAPLTLTFPDVELAGATQARLVLSAHADDVHNPDTAAWRLNYQLNDGPTHSAPFTFRPDGNVTAGYLFTIPVPTAELRNGNNTITFSGTGMHGGYQPYIGNIDLVVQ